MVTIPVAEWRPDIGSVNSAYTSNILNVLPVVDGYGPFPQCVVYSDALAAAPLNAFTARDTSGSVHVFAGTAGAIYKLNETAWDDVTKAATTYSATTDAPWDFAQFGNFVIAVNVNDVPQVFELGVSTEFADLGGSPPQARFVSVWGDYVALLNQSADATKVSWCDTNDITNWSSGVSGSQTFPDGGQVQGSTNSTNPMVFLERAIFFGTFVPGSSITFTFHKIHEKLGARSPYGIATRGAFTFFADEGAFYQIEVDGQYRDIGFERLNQTIFGQLAASDIATLRGEVDPFHTRAYFSIAKGGAGSFDTLLIYDWNLDRWSQASISHKLAFPAATPGYTLESLDGLGYSLDDLPHSLDSKVWQAGAPVLAVFDTANQLCFVSGDADQAIVETQELGDLSGQMTLIQSMLPIADTNNYTVRVGSRDRRGDAITYTPVLSPSSVTGRIDRLVAGRYHRIEVTIPQDDDWTTIQSVDTNTRASGRR